jgi:hypothetical protein
MAEKIGMEGLDLSQIGSDKKKKKISIKKLDKASKGPYFCGCSAGLTTKSKIRYNKNSGEK